MNALRQAWDRRPDGERRALALVGALAAIAVVTAFVWLPLERTRTRLAAELPRLRESVASLERQAEAVRRLKAMPPRAPTATPVAALAGSPANLPGAQVTTIDEGRLRLTAADVSFGALLDWITAARASHGLRVESARLDALPASGRVRAELVLARG